MTDTTTLRSLADDIDAMRHQIRQRDATIIRLRAERDTLRRELEAAKSGIDREDGYVEGFAAGANLTTIWKQAQAETLGLPIV